VLIEKITNATEMRTLDDRPNCLIIDEIDGTVGSESKVPHILLCSSSQAKVHANIDIDHPLLLSSQQGPIEMLIKKLTAGSKNSGLSSGSNKKGADNGDNDGDDGDEGGRYISCVTISLNVNKRTSEGNKSKKSKKSKKGERPLVRPIICICNDPYAPQLRRLKGHSVSCVVP